MLNKFIPVFLLAAVGLTPVAQAETLTVAFSPADTPAAIIGLKPNNGDFACSQAITADCEEVYANGESVNIFAKENPVQRFIDWSDACTGNSPVCTVLMDADKTATANFKPVALETPGGFSPANNSIEVGLNPTVSWTEVAGATTYRISFRYSKRKIYLVRDTDYLASAICSAGTCTLPGLPTLIEGQTHEMLIFAYGDTAASGTAKLTFTTMLGMGTLVVNASGNGSVSTSPALITNCTSTCSADATVGTSIQLIGTPDPGHFLTAIEAPFCDYIAPSCVFHLTAYKEATMIFAPEGTLPPPVLVSPLSTTISATSPTYTWNEVAGAARYRLILKTDTGTVVQTYLVRIDKYCDGATCTYTDIQPGNLLPSGNYVWGVRAIDNSNFLGSVITEGSFTILAGADKTLTVAFSPADTPAAIVSLRPNNGDIACSQAVTADCSEVFADGQKIGILAKENPVQRFINWSGGCSGNEMQCTVIMDADKTATANFVPVTLDAPSGFSPAHLSTGVSTSPTIMWTEVAGATTYRITARFGRKKYSIFTNVDYDAATICSGGMCSIALSGLMAGQPHDVLMFAFSATAASPTSKLTFTTAP